MKVSEFIEFLKTQDPEAIVQVLEDYKGQSCGEPYTDVNEAEFNPEKHVTVQDWTTNGNVKPNMPWYMKKYIILGKLH